MFLVYFRRWSFAVTFGASRRVVTSAGKDGSWVHTQFSELAKIVASIQPLVGFWRLVTTFRLTVHLMYIQGHTGKTVFVELTKACIRIRGVQPKLKKRAIVRYAIKERTDVKIVRKPAESPSGHRLPIVVDSLNRYTAFRR